jgi:hypothetical protein
VSNLSVSLLLALLRNEPRGLILSLGFRTSIVAKQERGAELAGDEPACPLPKYGRLGTMSGRPVRRPKIGLAQRADDVALPFPSSSAPGIYDLFIFERLWLEIQTSAVSLDVKSARRHTSSECETIPLCPVSGVVLLLRAWLPNAQDIREAHTRPEAGPVKEQSASKNAMPVS